MEKDKNSKKPGKIKVNFFTIEVNPVVFFILDFVLTTVFLLLLDLLWYKVIRNEEFHFSVFGNIILPLILSVTATVVMTYNAKKGK